MVRRCASPCAPVQSSGVTSRPPLLSAFLAPNAPAWPNPPNMQTHPLLQIQYFVERALPVAFQIERDVLEPQALEDCRKPLRHFQRQRAFHFFAGDFDADYLAVKTYAELAEAEGLNLLFAGLHGLDVLNGDRRSVGNAGTQTGRGGTVPGGQAGQAGEFADFGLGEAGIGQRGSHPMLGGGALARAVVAQVVHIDSVDDVLAAALAAQGCKAGEQFVLAVEAAVGTVAD